MIVVVCANPALDVTYRVDRLTVGEVHRTDSVVRRAGGKGTNVARVLRQLGQDVLLIAPLGGTSGAEFGADLAGVLDLVTVPIAASTRSSVAVVDDAGATVVNEAGPTISVAEWSALEHAVVQAVSGADALVLSGSVPRGAPDDAYGRLLALSGARPTVLDTSGSHLLAALSSRPTIVAPNAHEVRAALQQPDVSAAAAAVRLREAGAIAAVVSDGPDGLAASTVDGCWQARPASTVAGNPTGAGDAVTAALVAGLVQHSDWPTMLRDAVATGAAAVACPIAGVIDPGVRAAMIDTVRLEVVSR